MDLTTLGLCVTGAGVFLFLIGLPIATMDNPARRRRKNRSR